MITVDEFIKAVTVDGSNLKGIRTIVEFRDGEILESPGSLFGDFDPADVATIVVSMTSEVNRILCMSKSFNIEYAGSHKLCSVYEIDYSKIASLQMHKDVKTPYLNYKDIIFKSHIYKLEGSTLVYMPDFSVASTLILESEINRRDEFLDGWKAIVEKADSGGFLTHGEEIGEFYRSNLKNSEKAGEKIILAFREYTSARENAGKKSEKKADPVEEPLKSSGMMDLIKRKLNK